MTQAFCKVTEGKTVALMLNWIAHNMPKRTEVAIRIRDKPTDNGYEVFLRTTNILFWEKYRV